MALFPLNRTLVSEGARSFATLHAPTVETVPAETLRSARAEGEWKKWKSRMEIPDLREVTMSDNKFDGVQDTVGAVSWHHAGGMAAGVSRSAVKLLVEPFLTAALKVAVFCSSVLGESER
jgi:taspase (threonine aspartase 1)